MIRSLLLAVALVGVPSFIQAQDAPPPAEKPPLVQASARDEIVALAGKTATVEGKVTRVGATPAGGITFINFTGGADAFVAVVYKSDYAGFPEGFDKYKDQTVRLTGTVVLYKDTKPQIALKSASQVEIVPGAAEASPSPTN
jgi:hypothetical protein